MSVEESPRARDEQKEHCLLHNQSLKEVAERIEAPDYKFDDIEELIEAGQHRFSPLNLKVENQLHRDIFLAQSPILLEFFCEKS